MFTKALSAIIFLACGSETFEDFNGGRFHLDGDETSLSTGHYNTCAIEERAGIESGGPIRCWGDNRKGQSFSPLGIFVQVSCGLDTCCAVSNKDYVSCWGRMSRTLTGNFIQVSTGNGHACGIRKDGSMECWGQLYDEADPPIGHFLQVSSGNGMTCALHSSGLVECWGRDNAGQTTKVPSNVQFRQISVGTKEHVCGITLHNRDVLCWGHNGRGQADGRNGPFIQVSAGDGSTCAIREQNATIECWGSSRAPIPKHAMNATSYERISLGKRHGCAIDTERNLNCWKLGGDVSGADIVPVSFVSI